MARSWQAGMHGSVHSLLKAALWDADMTAVLGMSTIESDQALANVAAKAPSVLDCAGLQHTGD